MKVAAIPDPHYMDVSLYQGRADFVLENLDKLTTLVNSLTGFRQEKPVTT
jgi:hypothetical protein